MNIVVAYILDLIIGDPKCFYHPVRLIGLLISKLEDFLRTKIKFLNEYILGGILTFTIVVGSFIFIGFIKYITYKFNYIFGFIIESILLYFTFATRSLYDESMIVYKSLVNKELEESKILLSNIVGRDTSNLNKEEIIVACVETISENTADGVIAPILYAVIGGAPLAYAYKAINTLDSMVAYKNEKYYKFGYCSAKLDDIANFIPSRIAAFLMLISSFILKLDYKNAIRVFKEDRYKHLSPNSAQTEAIAAGALGLRLGGPSRYKGKLVDKPYIGKNIYEPETIHIRLCNRIMILSSLLLMVIIVIIKYIMEI